MESVMEVFLRNINDTFWPGQVVFFGEDAEVPMQKLIHTPKRI